MTIGIMSAMREEIESLLAEMKDTTVVEAGMRTYHQGSLWGTPVVLVFSRWGKVAAATNSPNGRGLYGLRGCPLGQAVQNRTAAVPSGRYRNLLDWP